MHLARKGRGHALRTAWSTSAAPVVAYMDVDLSTSLSALLPLVAPLLSGQRDVAIGTRLARGAHVVRGPKRELISRAYNLILRSSSCAAASATPSAASRRCGADAARQLLPLVEDDEWFFDTELLVTAERLGLRISEVPVDWVDDPDSRVQIVRTALDDLRGVWRIARGPSRPAPPLTARRAAGDQVAADQLLRFAGVGADQHPGLPLLVRRLAARWPAPSGPTPWPWPSAPSSTRRCTGSWPAAPRPAPAGPLRRLVAGLFAISLALTTLGLLGADLLSSTSLPLEWWPSRWPTPWPPSFASPSCGPGSSGPAASRPLSGGVVMTDPVPRPTGAPCRAAASPPRCSSRRPRPAHSPPGRSAPGSPPARGLGRASCGARRPTRPGSAPPCSPCSRLTAVLYLWDLGASGWANSFYSAAVQAGTKSWKALFFGSSDSSNFITVDKPPASLWVMEISARIFGLNSWSILVPQALEGVATVGVVYLTVRRWFSAQAALLAGAVVALTPVAAMMFRFNNPDALLALLLAGAVYATGAGAGERPRPGGWCWPAPWSASASSPRCCRPSSSSPPWSSSTCWPRPTGWWRRVWQVAVMGVATVVAAGWWVAAVS